MKLDWFRITFESTSPDTNYGSTEFTVNAKNFADAEKKALSWFDKEQKYNRIIIIERINKDNKYVQ